MELTWYGRTCIRLRGKDAVVVADPYPAVVGPTGRGMTGEIVTFSHPDDAPLRKAKGKVAARRQDDPADERRERVRPRRTRRIRGPRRPGDRRPHLPRRREGQGARQQTAFVIELDGLHTIHLGDIGHLLTQEKIGDIGSVDVACVPVGGALTATRAAELIAQLDPRIVVPMPVCEDEAACEEALRNLLPRDGRRGRPPQPALAITPVEPADRDDDRAPRGPRQGLTAAPTGAVAAP